MKKILILIACIAFVANASAEQHPRRSNFEGVRVSNIELKRTGNTMHISMSMELGGKDMHTDRATIYTPILYHGNNEVVLPSVGVYGHNSYVAMVREEAHSHTIPLDWQLRHKDLPAEVDYRTEVDYMPWMNGAELTLVEQLYGCHDMLLGIADIVLGKYSEPTIVPTYIFVIPETIESGTTHYTRTAQLDFPQNVADIEANFNGNKGTIATIDAMLESLSGNGNATIKHLTVRGSVSPEGERGFNDELAHERAEALLDHIEGIVNIPAAAVSMEYDTDNWAKVREWVAQSKLSNRDAIVKFIDTHIASGKLNSELMERYPREYHAIFEQFYPTLRLAEFTLDYDVKNFKEVDRIVAIARIEPESLSDDELNTAAANLDQSSPEFENVVMMIVAKHPNDAAANLNAANVKMRRGELAHAEHYLKRAGTSAEADYARALFALHTGNYGEAKRLLTKVEKQITHAATLLNKMKEAGM